MTGAASCLLLLLTLLVYRLLTHLHNLHGSIVTANCGTALLLTLYLLAAYTVSPRLDGLVCTLLGYTGYFFTLSMFAWMAVLGADLARTFLPARPARRGSSTQFRLYSVAVWTTSAGLTAAVAAADMFLPDVSNTITHVLVHNMLVLASREGGWRGRGWGTPAASCRRPPPGSTSTYPSPSWPPQTSPAAASPASASTAPACEPGPPATPPPRPRPAPPSWSQSWHI